MEFVRSTPRESWHNTSPGATWQARDYVAHLASIDPLLAAAMRDWQSASADGMGGSFSIDDWNEEQILARRSTPIPDLLDEMERNRADLNAALADFTDEQLDQMMHFAGDSKRAPRDVPVHLFLTFWAFHDRWHMEDARRAIAGEEEQAFGDAAMVRMAADQS
jgi:hypothetical protein